MSTPSQFSLLKSRRFLPFFLTQSLGAFNDNVFKQALILAILYKLNIAGDTTVWINLCALLFILPFFLFSALGGQIGEKFDKHRLIRALKLFELLIMLAGAVGFWLNSLPLLLAALFCMGLQSALFGPVKYSILPQVLGREELVGGNALVEMGTFLAILGGTIGAGVMLAGERWEMVVATAVLAVAVLGYAASHWIPPVAAVLASLKLNWNLPQQTWATLKLGLSQKPAVSRSLIGSSWFWFIGATYLTQIPAYAKDLLGGDESVVTLILTVFSVAIGLGSMLCERMSGRQVEIGLVPFGSLGLSVFGLLLWWHTPDVATTAAAIVMEQNWRTVLAHGSNWWILASIFGLGLFGGFYIVPLYALIQSRTPAQMRARVIAANNILNALFMVCSALVAMLLLAQLKLSIPQLFLVVALANVAVNAYIFKIVPEFTMRFLVWLMGHSLYRVRHEGFEHVPEKGGALMVCNHVSLVDAVILAGALRRPTRFVMYWKIYNLPVLRFIARAAGCIPIAPRGENAQVYEAAFEKIGQYLENGELVCIFPEGKLTCDGEMAPFRDGVTRILKDHPVPVVPVALQGLWGSYFSRAPKRRLLRHVMPRVAVVVGKPVAPDAATPAALHAEVARLRGDVR